MGMISDVLQASGAANAVRDTARAIAGAVAADATRQLTDVGQEAVAAAKAGAFDRIVDALNRLPRPLMALGAMALIGYAMDDPAGFAQRMQGLRAMPSELWWLIGGVITFYFGAREAHYLRAKAAPAQKGTGAEAK